MRRKYSFFACIMVLAAIYTYYFNINSYILISLGIILGLSIFAKNRTRLYLLLSAILFFLTAIYTNYRGQSIFKKYKNEREEYIIRVQNLKEYDGYSTFFGTVKILMAIFLMKGLSATTQEKKHWLILILLK